MRIRRLAALTAALLTAGAVSLAPTLAPAASAATPEWQDGASESDVLVNCVTGQPSPGMTAATGWLSPTGQVPKVGERFYLRGYIGLVGRPCSDQALAIPEVLAPPGIEFVEEPFLWDVYALGAAPQLASGGVDFWKGLNGGVTITLAGDEPFRLSRGEVLEFQFPVRATRELKGTATPAPTCQTRRDGDAPCPVAQSGDHLQVAFNIADGGDRSYVIPYVPLFAAAAGTGGGGGGGGDTTAPQTRVTGGPADGGIATSSSATFDLGSSEAGSRITCQLDGQPRACAPGAHTVTGLAPGTHTFTARATDAAGNTDRNEVSRTWTVPTPARSLKGKGWKLRAIGTAYDGQARVATRKGATLTVGVRDARRLALVAATGGKSGKVKVYAGKRLLTTVSLKGAAGQRVIPVTTFGSPFSGKIRIVVVTRGRTVQVEGVAAPTR